MNLLEIRLEKLREILGTDLETGLTGEQVLRTRREFGENILFEKKNTVQDLVKKIFGDVMMVLFLLVSLFDFLESGNPASLFAALSVSVLYSAFVLGTHFYVANTKKKFDRYFSTRYHVRRSGRVTSVEKSELVPGDILLLEKGDVMPCDGIILKHSALKILEASVTGTRVPVFKRSHEEVQAENSGYPYFECILFAGSVILHGSAKVFVCNTGPDIFDNQNFTISRQNSTVPRIYETAMDLKKQISMIWVLVCLLLFAWGVFRGQEVFGIFHYATATIIAAFPDSMEHLCDLAIAYMTRKLYREGVILRNPGSVDRLCDVNSVFVNSSEYLFHSHPIAGSYYVGNCHYDFKENPEPATELLENLLLAQSSKRYFSGKTEEWQGEKAILAAAASLGIQKRNLDRKFLHINSYDPDDRYGFSCAMLLCGETYRLVIRGIPNAVLRCCDHVVENGEKIPLTPAKTQQIKADIRHLAGTCERIIAVAVLELSSPSTRDQRTLCRHMTYLGLFGLSTPISAAAATAVSVCQKAGVQTYLLTDDYPETVSALSKNVSIIGNDDYQHALSYQTYERMDRGVFVADIEKYKAYCGFPVEEKQSIVKYHKDNGNITLSLTDGIYDTLPQMESDISVVGVDEKLNAVRLNADLLVIEKRFELVPLCINWARKFYRNIVHLMQYTLCNQMALGTSVFIALAASSSLPFAMLPMLLAGLGACLPAGFNVFNRTPRPRLEDNLEVLKDDRIASLRALIITPLLVGLVEALAMMLSHRIALYTSGSVAVAQGATIITLIFSSWLNSVSIKFDSSLFRNLKEVGRSELYTFVVCVMVSYLLTASPVTLLWQETVECIRFWPIFFAVLLSLIPAGIFELMKQIRFSIQKDPANERD